ncbi:Bbp16 family capsid cement protein [Rhizobium sp. YAF28]|uniref:Bbp16 family capsid cement protein n=1 Tax=Rhizobium sp. YAF28 TaxID=3233081 RepID=UPI003F945010
MIFDRQTLLSDAQVITATGPSTNVINLGPIKTGLTRDIGKGEPIPFLMQVVEGFNNLTSLAVTIQTDDNEAFASPKAVITTTLTLADLKAGKIIPPSHIPRGTDELYLRLLYTVTGTAPTTGKITAGFTAGVPSHG